jgi:hypothetical protein
VGQRHLCSPVHVPLSSLATGNGDEHQVTKAENGVTTTHVAAVLGLSPLLMETSDGKTTDFVFVVLALLP